MNKERKNDQGRLVEFGFEKRDGYVFAEVTSINCQARVSVLIDGNKVNEGLWVFPSDTSYASAKIEEGQKYYCEWEWDGNVIPL